MRTMHPVMSGRILLRWIIAQPMVLTVVTTTKTARPKANGTKKEQLQVIEKEDAGSTATSSHEGVGRLVRP